MPVFLQIISTFHHSYDTQTRCSRDRPQTHTASGSATLDPVSFLTLHTYMLWDNMLRETIWALLCGGTRAWIQAWGRSAAHGEINFNDMAYFGLEVGVRLLRCNDVGLQPTLLGGRIRKTQKSSVAGGIYFFFIHLMCLNTHCERCHETL